MLKRNTGPNRPLRPDLLEGGGPSSYSYGGQRAVAPRAAGPAVSAGGKPDGKSLSVASIGKFATPLLFGVLGALFNWESRRADNYDALAELAQHRDPVIAATAFHLFERTTSECAPLNEQMIGEPYADMGCSLSPQHRVVLARMVTNAEFTGTATGSVSRVLPKDATLADLVDGLADPSFTVRFASANRLFAEDLDDPEAIRALLAFAGARFSDAGATSDGRYMALRLLEAAPDDAWLQSGRIDSARAGLDRIRDAARSGELVVGDATRSALDDLERRLARLAARQTPSASAAQSPANP